MDSDRGIIPHISGNVLWGYRIISSSNDVDHIWNICSYRVYCFWSWLCIVCLLRQKPQKVRKDVSLVRARNNLSCFLSALFGHNLHGSASICFGSR